MSRWRRGRWPTSETNQSKLHLEDRLSISMLASRVSERLIANLKLAKFQSKVRFGLSVKVLCTGTYTAVPLTG